MTIIEKAEAMKKELDAKYESLMKKDCSTPNFDKILQLKIAYYGNTAAAYDFACEEYRSQVKQTTKQGSH